MSEYPSLPYTRIIGALMRDGWAVIRQRGSHIRLHKHTPEGRLVLTVPAHRPVNPFMLARILRDAELPLERFKQLL